MRAFSILMIAGILMSVPVFSQIQTTIATLRTIAASTTTPYFITDQGREGIFYYDPKDLTSADNGGTVIVNGSKRYKRMYSGPLDVRWFGMKADWNGSAGS